jgi:endonuclease VIII
MSEGPEIYRLAARLHGELAGSRVAAVSTDLPGPAAWLASRQGALLGRAISRIYPAGKHLLWELEGGFYLHFHLTLFGRMRSYPLDEPPPPDKTVRAEIETTARRVRFSESRVFHIGEGDPRRDIEALAALGPDICQKPFDAAGFLARLSAPVHLAQELGPALLEQTIAAGVGNYLKSDALFECRLNPFSRVYQLGEEDRRALAAALPEMAQRSIKHRGLTVSDAVRERLAEAPAYSDAWWDGHWVFRRAGRPCWVCGAKIQQRRQGPGEGRATYYCPRCQGVR